MSVKIIMRYYSLFFRALPLTKNCFGQKATLCLNQEKRMLFKEKRASTDFDRFY